MQLEELKKHLSSAKCPEDIFGDDPKSQYKTLVKIAHPDSNHGHEKEASEVFVKLSVMWGHAEDKIAKGTYGDKKPIISLTLSFRGGELNVSDKIKVTGLYKHFAAEHDGSTYVLKTLRDYRHRKIYDNEVAVLKALHSARPTHRNQFSPFPVIAELLTIPVDKGIYLPGMLLFPVEVPDMQPLLNIIPKYGPMDPRDAIWMVNRVVELCAFMHDLTGLIHGGLNPSVIDISTAHHLSFVDGWHNAVPKGFKVSTVDSRYSSFQHPDVREGKPIKYHAVIYSAAAMLRYLVNGSDSNAVDKFPRKVAGMIRAAMLHTSPFDSINQFYQEMTDAFEFHYGPKKFRPFDYTSK